ncbi:unnamed protein product [Peronospora belbahrii]|uniref:Uncharacterized protein n=1 Tax=Peronospora belbahrii TaxID=622444 RepID=A0AAU9LG99_9STRA|nr:unnamed protein product [Peronospora belbahrii]
MQSMCSMALLCWMAVTNPGRGGPLQFESAFVLEIMRRMIVKCLEHGERTANPGIVCYASRLDLIGFLLNIFDNSNAIGKVKEPHVVRAEAIKILNLLEKVQSVLLDMLIE